MPPLPLPPLKVTDLWSLSCLLLLKEDIRKVFTICALLLAFKTQQVSKMIIPGITSFWEHSLPQLQILVRACLQPHVRWHRGCLAGEQRLLWFTLTNIPGSTCLIMTFPLEVCFPDFGGEMKEKLNNYRTWDVSDFHWCRVAFMQIIFLLACGLKHFLPGSGNLEKKKQFN